MTFIYFWIHFHLPVSHCAPSLSKSYVPSCLFFFFFFCEIKPFIKSLIFVGQEVGITSSYNGCNDSHNKQRLCQMQCNTLIHSMYLTL